MKTEASEKRRETLNKQGDRKTDRKGEERRRFLGGCRKSEVVVEEFLSSGSIFLYSVRYMKRQTNKKRFNYRNRE